MSITASMVKDLREKTGAGMMDCKKALNETEGDFEAAVDWLRKKGLSSAAKKSGRTAADGLIGLALRDDGLKASLVEVNAETDFVARNDVFQDFVRISAKSSLDAHDMDGLLASNFADTGRSLNEQLTHNIATIGENMTMRRFQSLGVDQGAVAGYIHGAIEGSKGTMGRIGVLVGLESAADQDALQPLAKQIAMHVAAAMPKFLSVEEIAEEDRIRERAILTEQAKAEGRPENIIAKMVEGRMAKFHEEVALLEQVFVVDNKTKISTLLTEKAKELGSPITLKGFVRLQLGEGIERKQEDFAAEVAAAVAG